MLSNPGNPCQCPCAPFIARSSACLPWCAQSRGSHRASSRSRASSGKYLCFFLLNTICAKPSCLPSAFRVLSAGLSLSLVLRNSVKNRNMWGGRKDVRQRNSILPFSFPAVLSVSQGPISPFLSFPPPPLYYDPPPSPCPFLSSISVSRPADVRSFPPIFRSLRERRKKGGRKSAKASKSEREMSVLLSPRRRLGIVPRRGEKLSRNSPNVQKGKFLENPSLR